jgi:predicted nucleotidyltransferase
MNKTDKFPLLIQDILAKIVAGYSPQRVILFGSYAYGEPDEDSDIDLLIIKDTDAPPIERWTTVKRLVRDRSRRTSVSPLVYTTLTMSHSKAVPRLLARDRQIPALCARSALKVGIWRSPLSRNRLSA